MSKDLRDDIGNEVERIERGFYNLDSGLRTRLLTLLRRVSEELQIIELEFEGVARREEKPRRIRRRGKIR